MSPARREGRSCGAPARDAAQARADAAAAQSQANAATAQGQSGAAAAQGQSGAAAAAARAEAATALAAAALAADGRRTRWWFLGIGLLALALRALYLLQASTAPLFEHLIVDAKQYSLWAHTIAQGDWLGDKVFYQAPLYPYLMAVVEIVAGPGPAPLRLLQILIGALSCSLLYLAGRRLFSQRVGATAGVLLACYPPAIFFDSLVQKASVGGLFTVLLIWLVARARGAPRPWLLLGLGAAQGLLMLTREETLLLVPVLLAWVLWSTRAQAWGARLLAPAALMGGLLLVLAPVALRNWVVGGELVLTTAQAGPNFYIGNNPSAKGIYEPLRPGRSNTAFEREDAVELAETALGRELSASEVSSYWFGRSWSWIRAEPLAWLRLLGRKALLMVNAYEVADAEDFYYYAQHSWLLDGLSRVLHLGTVLPLAAAGLLLSWSRRRELGLLLALLATLMAGVVLFYVFARYRYPIVPFALLLAAAALVQGLALARVGAWRALVLPLAALLGTAILANWPLYNRAAGLASAYHNAGAALSTAGRANEAAAQYRRALELAPTAQPETWSNLGLLYARARQWPDALACFRRSLELRPDDPRFLERMGTALFESGDAAGAEVMLQRSAELYPRDPQAWNNLRYVLIMQQRWERALEVARTGAAANPGDTGLAIALAWLLAACPEERLRVPGEALQIARSLDQAAQGRDADVADVLALALAAGGRHTEAAEATLRAARLAREAGQLERAQELEARAEGHAAAAEGGR